MKPTYSEKLLDPRWQRKRLEVMDFWAFSCSECGEKTKTLHVHHQWYIPNREPWEYPMICFQALCKDCHDDRHSQVGEERSDRCAELELLIGTLFDPREMGFDCSHIAFAVSQLCDAGANLPAIRDAICDFLSSDSFWTVMQVRIDARAARRAASEKASS